MLAGADAGTQQKMSDFGLSLGLAFQIADDVLDYTADSKVLGKNLGDDLAEGKATLPVIHAMAQSSTAVRQQLAQIIRAGDALAMPVMLQAIRQADSLAYSHAAAQRFTAAADQALDGLPDNSWTNALRGLTAYAIQRNH